MRNPKKLSRFLDQSVWFFDYDGSLCPHTEIWEERAYDPQGILQILSDFESRIAALYWNTGRRLRSLAEVDEGFLRFSGYFMHGTSYWDAGERRETVLSPHLPKDFVESFTEKIASESGWLKFEVKATGLRIAPIKLNQLDRLYSWSEGLLSPDGFTWHQNHRAVELAPDSFDKGSAIRHALSKLKVKKANPLPVAIGDDVSDRAAIAEVLKLGGHALLVGEGCGWITEIPHRADQINFFEAPIDVHRFLQNLLSEQ